MNEGHKAEGKRGEENIFKKLKKSETGKRR